MIHQIYPRSFLDTDGDGVGDLEGIRRKLPYLASLGVDAIWLSPFFRSPMADFGYDVSDYCDVDPLFGSLADFDAVLSEAHEHGLRVIIDFVPNHSSDQHPWFIDARSSRDAPHRDWYVWRDGTPDRPPNDWKGTFHPDQSVPGTAWTWDETTSQWYLHLFLPEQPDLDWTNPAVVEAMHAALRFWLERGVDGFRIDVVHFIGKDVPAVPDPIADGPGPEPAPLVHQLLRDLRVLLDSYPGDRVMVGEVYILSTRQVAAFYGNDDELHMSFNFLPLYAPFEADAWRKRIDRAIAEFDPIAAWPTWVLSNHDNARHRTRYGSADRARAACLLLLGLRGTPFLYAGEELGLEDAAVPPSRVVDPGGRDGCRAPIPWEPGPNHGWPTPDAWLPWPPGDDAQTQAASPDSFLNLYHTALAFRHSSAALASGAFAWCDSPPGVLIWERSAPGADPVRVMINMSDDPVSMPSGYRVEVASSSSIGVLPPSAAAWLRPV